MVRISKERKVEEQTKRKTERSAKKKTNRSKEQQKKERLVRERYFGHEKTRNSKKSTRKRR